MTSTPIGPGFVNLKEFVLKHPLTSLVYSIALKLFGYSLFGILGLGGYFIGGVLIINSLVIDTIVILNYNTFKTNLNEAVQESLKKLEQIIQRITAFAGNRIRELFASMILNRTKP